MAVREAIAVPTVLVAAAVSTIGVAIPSRGTHATGWFPWALLAMGIAGIAAAVFDRAQKGGGWRSQGLALLVGPFGSRIVFALIGGGFLGGAIGILSTPAA